MRISVIIPTLNEERYLGGCLAALLAQTRKPDEIIVADGGSSDSTCDIAAEYGALVVRAKKPGIAHGRNQGAAAASGDILFFTDADCQPAPDWIEQMARCFDRDIVGAAGPTYPINGSRAHYLLYSLSCHYLMRMTTLLRMPLFNGWNCAYRASAFRAIGGFNEALVTAEDLDLSLRMRTQGRMCFCPHAIVRTSTRREERFGLGRLALFHTLNGLRFLFLRRPASFYPAVR